MRAHAKLTHAEFAARIGLPIETVRNRRAAPARTLLKLLDRASDLAFTVLAAAKPAR
jgi:DNA-binding transcriptional regulator YiaG